MRHLPNHYELLGISPDADAAEIRAAYLALIKRHHPDAPGAAQASARSRDINSAYSVLKDPAKRALYDAQIDTVRRAADRIGARGRALMVAQAQDRDRRRGSGRKALGAALALSALVGAGLALLYLAPPSAPSPAAVEIAVSEPRTRRPPLMLEIHEAEVAEAVSDLAWIARNGAPEDAVVYSRRCYQELGFFANLRMLDWCLAFDLAAAQWLRERRRGTPPFFLAETMRMRHQRAMEGLAVREEEAESRLLRISERVIAGLAAGPPPRH